jgi:hypothetical protein
MLPTAISRRPLTALVAALVVLLSAATGASVSVPIEFRDMVAAADLIVRGRVTDVRATRSEDAGVESVATVAVENALKGTSDSFVYVRVPGGEVGRYRYVMAGAPVLRVNELAVFFLRRGADNSLRPIGLSAGIYAIGREPSTGRPVVRPPVVADRTGTAAPRGDVRRTLVPVGDFESLVRLMVAARTAAPRSSR